VLFVAYHAVLLGVMETDCCPQDATAFKVMALEALFIRYAPPRFVAGGTVLNGLMRQTHGPRLSSCIIEKEPAGKGYHEKNSE
jgi:hypothetical protein